ncbi:pilZ domain protein [Geobacter sp. OR-1]|uniref:PilZ domain-containing protein n=1 Tax=Geobacter sp. OR-1 TaxID=1266765 RepID=UPI00054358CF|nr:PilZ domain-containing protein [Geobacter sp. OR-1]GAM09238.1 pilZ domain protein [Geobacter sp. OR-1]
MDNRQFSRMDFNARVLVSHEGSSFTGTVENLSLKGLFVKTDQKVPLDETVGIVLSFAGSNGNLSLSLEGKVVRVADDGIGLNFKKISVDFLEQTLGNDSECAGEACRMRNELCQAAV